jgi:hypothetical protein
MLVAHRTAIAINQRSIAMPSEGEQVLAEEPEHISSP